MNKQKESHREMLPWRLYTTVAIQSLILFYVATFLVALYFSSNGLASITKTVLTIACYLTIIGLILRKVVKKFSIAALMLIVPTAPLIAMIFLLTMLPILEWLR